MHRLYVRFRTTFPSNILCREVGLAWGPTQQFIQTFYNLDGEPTPEQVFAKLQSVDPPEWLTVEVLRNLWPADPNWPMGAQPVAVDIP